MRRNHRLSGVHCFLVALLTIGAVSTALSWGSTGHRIINQKAPMHLPLSMASWRADSAFFAAHASDADNRKNSNDTSFWAEAPRHFIDIDWYPNFHSLSHNLDSVIAQYGRSTVRTQGLVPWATVMELDSLTAQFRRGNIAKAESTMADIGHYVGDAHQPLHCAKNFDGQLTGNNGVHSRYETSMINRFQTSLVINLDSIHYISSPIDFIFDYIYHSNSYTDTIMAADTYAKSVSGWSGSGSQPASYDTALWLKCGTFTKDQFQRATIDLASLWYTAWVNSQAPLAGFDTIIASAFGGGAITPSGLLLTFPNRDTIFTFTPQIGYHVDSVTVDGSRVDSVTEYTFHTIAANHTINVWFGVNQFTITSSAGPNGSISPLGTVNANFGENRKFIVTPATGYHVDSVIVDGARVDSATSFTFTNISVSHSISATFAINHYAILANAGSHGSLFPSGVIMLAYGDSQSVSLKPDSGYFVDSVIIDGAFAGKDTNYTFHSVNQNHTLSVNFTDGSISMNCTVADNWNILSVPLHAMDCRAPALFPTALSGVFYYEGGYVAKETLSTGAAYWVKFRGIQTLKMVGKILDNDTIDVNEGWNMIGSISWTIPVSQITSLPAGIVTSNFFEYQGGYRSTDSIHGGYGYWVKVNQQGKLILSFSHYASAASRITIVPTNELPPVSPTENIASAALPKNFALGSAYPNPFNPSTVIRYQLPVSSWVTLKIYDILGGEAATLVNEIKQPGEYTVQWDASGSSSGIYFYRLQSGSFVETKKLLLLK